MRPASCAATTSGAITCGRVASKNPGASAFGTAMFIGLAGGTAPNSGVVKPGSKAPT